MDNYMHGDLCPPSVSSEIPAGEHIGKIWSSKLKYYEPLNLYPVSICIYISCEELACNDQTYNYLCCTNQILFSFFPVRIHTFQ